MIGWRDGDGELHRASLFGVFAALAREDAWSFPALRPHQREPWHAFTVQVAALALIRAGLDALPTDQAAWRDLLIGLTPEYPDGEAWELVVNDWSKPALLQPPVVADANRADYRTKNEDILQTPDALDMLVTSRNHDVKQERIGTASEEDWLFALVTLQTMEGIMGAGKYGISRMFGGYGNRMSLSVRPTYGGASARFKRDVHRLVVDARTRSGRRGGIPLLWPVPWDGTVSLDIETLDELYVEICRRVRLRRTSGRLQALSAGSKCSRVAGDHLGGNTKDPWMPLAIDTKKDRKTFGKLVGVTPGRAGFGYRQMANLLDKQKVTEPFLAQLHDDDDRDGLAIVASALARGQGKTEGLHRRTVRLSRVKEMGSFGDLVVFDRIGNTAQRRAGDAWEGSRRLRRALIILMSSGEDRDDLMRARDGDAEAWTAALRRFDHLVDQKFFDDRFWVAVTRDDAEDDRNWRQVLRGIAESVLAEAAANTPRSEMRRDKARARAENRLEREMDAWLKEVASGEHA